MAVGGDEAAVEADLARRACGDHGQLGGEEVLLRQTVFFVQEHQDGERHAVGALVVLQRAAAEQDAQVLARHALGQRLAHLVGGQVDQQVGHAEDGITRLLADGHGDDGAVLLRHDAVDGQRGRRPLILLDAAVVMRLEIGHARILIQGIRLQVQTRGIDVGRADVRALVQALAADDGENHALVVVVAVDAVAGLQLHAGLQFPEAGLLSSLDRPLDGLPLHLAVADEFHVLLAVGLHRGKVRLGNAVIAVLGAGKQRFALLCELLGFFHHQNSFQKLLTLLLKCLRRRRVRPQGMAALGPQGLVALLCPDAGKGALAGDAVAPDEPLDARFLGRKHADRLVAQGSKAAFEQADGVDGGKRCLRLPKPPPYLARNGLMRQGIEGRKLRRIGKHDGGQRRAVDPAVPDRAGKTRADGGNERGIRLQQAVINGVAVEAEAAQPLYGAQQRRFPAAASAGDAENFHASCSASTTRKAAAFFRRLPTA